MQLGMIGLGRMGSYMVQRLLKAGHQCVVYDSHPQAMQELVGERRHRLRRSSGFREEAQDAAGCVADGSGGAVDSVLASLVTVLAPGDIVIDGGNSYYHDDIRRAEELKTKGIHYVDCGTSGGVWGLDRGYCLMIGGEEASSASRSRSSNPSRQAWPQRRERRGRTGEPPTAENGYLRCGPNGAGHFVKMVHNGIEYGIMAAFAEGLNIIKNANVGKVKREDRCRNDAAAPS